MACECFPGARNPRCPGCGDEDAWLQLHVNEDGSTFPVNCESNRRMLERRFAEVGQPYMTASTCGFLLTYKALKPDGEEHLKAEKVAIDIYGGLKYAKTPAFCQAAAMKVKAEHPLLFERMADEAFVIPEWLVEYLDN